jgi:uncharacterized RDD family membrane protein YckC
MNQKNILTAVIVVLGISFAFQSYNTGRFLLSGFFDVGSFLRLIPLVIGFAALIIFITSKYKKHNLLRFYMGVQVFMYPFIILSIVRFFTKEETSFTPGLQWNALYILGVSLGFLVFVACCTGLWMLSRTRVAKLRYNIVGDEQFPEFSPAPASLRFLNRLADTIVYVFVALIFINNGLFGEGIKGNDSTLGFVLVEIPFLIVYYLFFESIFSATPAKCLTNTIVVNESGERAGFMQILGRTFCRLIPFEAFTFLGSDARGWHDSIPNTYVVESVDINEQKPEEFLLDAERELS